MFMVPTKISDNVLELVGNTPMVRLDRIRKVLGIEASPLVDDFFI